MVPNYHEQMHSVTSLIKDAGTIPLSPADADWLRMLVGDWQVIADLAAADLVLWLPTEDGNFVAAEICRSATAATMHVEDIIGLSAPAPRAAQLAEAMETKEILAPPSVHWAGLYSTTVACIPVVREGHCFAAISREANVSSAGRQTGAQGWTIEVADILCQMIADGEYPDPKAPAFTGHSAPRAVDGTILIDDDGCVLAVSPNANSYMRRLGISQDLVGTVLIEDVMEAMRHGTRIEETLAVVVMGKAPWGVDVEANGATVAMRAIPLFRKGKRIGALLLTRDVTDARKQEQALMTKDATIREIHHRVKNNLQTVSALLRIQERRSDSAEVRDALREAGRRVESIATVHDVLAQDVREVVRFDEVAERILQMAVRVATAGSSIDLAVSGTFGEVGAEQASALATVLTELISNAVEHGSGPEGGQVQVNATRDDDLLTVTIADDGPGLDDGEVGRGLGTQIVRALVGGELHGTIEWESPKSGGTKVILRFKPDTTRSDTPGESAKEGAPETPRINSGREATGE